MEQRGSIVKGTAVLAGAGLVARIMGAGYRIILARLIGNEGIGLYQMAYPVYLMFLSLSNAGIPIAISKIVAEKIAAGDRAGTKRVLAAALLLMLGLGAALSAGMGLAGRWIAGHVVADSRAVFAIWALAPAIFFMSLMAGFRGYFQGWREMTPSAISQIIEQAVRVTVALLLALMLLKYGVEYAAAGAAFGATMGGLAGVVFLARIFWSWRRRFRGGRPARKEALGRIVGRLVKFTLPIALSVILMPLLQTLDSVIVPAKLQSIGYTIRQATAMLGILGNSWAVLYLPLIVTGAIASNLVPAIAELGARRAPGLVREKAAEGLRLAAIYLVPATVALFAFGPSIYRILYGQPGVELLSWVAPAILFLGLEQVSAGTLQGLGKPHLPLIHFLAGAGAKIIVTLAVTGWPGLNLAGAALGTVAGSGVTALLNLVAVRRLAATPFPLQAPVCAAGAAMLAVCWWLPRQVAWNFGAEFLMAGAAGVIIYIGVLWILGGIGVRDLEIISGLVRKSSS